MGGGGSSIPQTYHKSGLNLSEDVNLASAHSIDLSRKYVVDENAANKALRDGINRSTFGAPFTIGKDTIPTPPFQNNDPNIETSISPANYQTYSQSLWYGPIKLHPGGQIHQLEDRVMDSNGKALHFDMLPEVKDLQYRFSLLPLARSSNNDRQFKSNKKKLSSNTSPYTYGSEILHHPSSFRVTTKSINPQIYDRSELDPHGHIHDNIISMIDNPTHQNESLEEHINGITKSFHSLMDKFESGEYRRHPNFWNGHLFAEGNDRSQIWKSIGDRLTTQDEYFQKVNK